jgi:hypothetical protein
LQDIHNQLSAHHFDVQAALGSIAGKRNLAEGEFRYVLAVLRNARDALDANLQAAGRLHFPPLKNVTAGAPLGPFLLGRPLVYRLAESAKSLDGAWIGEFLGQLGEVLDKAQRILFKSLGGILTLQEEIALRWAAGAESNLAI